jgi:hypothetical protein
MMIADTGFVWKVEGRRREIVATGPMPGRTPIKVPMRQPIKQKNKFSFWIAIKNAIWRLDKRSIAKIQEFLWGVEF